MNSPFSTGEVHLVFQPAENLIDCSWRKLPIFAGVSENSLCIGLREIQRDNLQMITNLYVFCWCLCNVNHLQNEDWIYTCRQVYVMNNIILLFKLLSHRLHRRSPLMLDFIHRMISNG